MDLPLMARDGGGNYGLTESDAAVARWHALVQVHCRVVREAALDTLRQSSVLEAAARENNGEFSALTENFPNDDRRRMRQRVVKARLNDRGR
jgi:hypothetical protein